MSGRIKFLLAIILVFCGSVYSKAEVKADDYVTSAIEALKTTDVYVAPGIPGTDYNTPNKLRVFLEPKNNVVLVMLPAEALEGTDMHSLVRTISSGLGDQKTIGLAVGKKMIGYSPILPETVAAEQMVIANSVSQDPVTALVTFSRNINIWLISNPQPLPTPTPRPTPVPVELPKAEDVPSFIWIVLGVAGLLVVFVFLRGVIRSVKKNTRANSLEPMRTWIRNIETNINDIKEFRVREDLRRATLAARGLLEIFEASEKPMGYVEEKFPDLLANVNRQVKAFARHESGIRPLPEDFYSKLRKVLMNYDSLFIKLQENDPESVDILASLIDSENTMMSQMGYMDE